MCNQGIGCLLQLSSLHSENLLNHHHHNQMQQQQECVYRMDSPASSTHTPGSNDETPRIKLLCSFAGSFLPRPQDGKLRYVGGETRIVSLPRDITYDELIGRMRELFEGVATLKYQQPDEDLDALVSVVNNDDVTNMMEEYDKLGSGDGFTRLRIFLFSSHPDQDAASSPYETDERETERRYVDALNSLNDTSPDTRKQLHESPPVMGTVVDNIHVAEQFFNQMSLESGLHNQRNCEMPLPQFNLHHLTIPHLGMGQHQQSHSQRYNEMEAPWSPAYYSPRHHGHHEPRPMTEFPSSPSSGLYRMPFGELPDKSLDRMPEEYGRQPMNHQAPFDHHPPPFVDNVVWLPPGAIPGEKAGFPGNLGQPHNVFEGNNICENCRMTFQRNQTSPDVPHYPDSRWKHGAPTHLEPANSGNEFHQFTNSCAQCASNREAYVLNPDTMLDHGIYSKELNEPQPFYNDSHSLERGWVLHHQINHRVEEPRLHMSGAGRMNEHYMVDATGVNFPLAHGNCYDGHQVSSNCINHEDSRYIRSGHELGNEGFHEQTLGAGPHIHIPPLEDRGIRYGNFPSAYGTDNLYQVSHGPMPAQALWRKGPNAMHGAPSYEPSTLLPQANGIVNSGFPRGTQEGSPRLHIGVDNPNPWVGPSHKLYGFDGSAFPEYFHGYGPKINSNTICQENHQSFAADPVRSPADMADFTIPMEPVPLVRSPSSMIDNKMIASTSVGHNSGLKCDTNASEAVRLEDNNMPGEGCEAKHIGMGDGSDRQCISNPGKIDVEDKNNGEMDKKNVEADSELNDLQPADEGGDNAKLGETDLPVDGKLSLERFNFLPELIASVKKAALEGVEEVRTKAQEHVDGDDLHDPMTEEAALNGLETVNAPVDLEVESDIDLPNISKIEPTKAEAEALARGLQTIKNDDLEEIRELGSGTYGSVYHGKWKGSDVAIKRIKASCFAGKPSERQRLIADFWKEALILSSLHHPNVVSFYGIVRDGPDGSLATVTEFMVNGSLKQFLQKKDRTIDRRKRLIIAMDAAFGMEYLHGKNIVHFDLKCENLLVNMRDPQRPVCKIGDLGLSKVKQHTLVSGGVRGTLPWMAPELLSGKSHMVTEKIDVYSFGIVMWELLTGEEPYTDMHCASIIGGIVNNTLRPQVPTWCDPEWKSLMESCWASEPGERPSFSQISQKLRRMSAAINVK